MARLDLPRRAPARALASAALLALGACSEARPLEPGARRGPSWIGEIEPLMQASCAPCHAGPTAAGAYDVTSYLGALGPGSDARPNAIAGDAGSLVVVELDPATARPEHGAVLEARQRLLAWVVDARLALRRDGVHEGGILNPGDAEAFHGALARRLAWDLDRCAECHGPAFAGGAEAPTCLGCHPQGPDACDTCHGMPPATGAHLAHTRGPTLDKRLGCPTCHPTPIDYRAPGHARRADGSADDEPAEVELSGLAGATLPSGGRRGAPTWDPSSGTCANVYCHGDALDDRAALHPVPSWRGGDGQAACGGCHGLAPSSHAATRCASCHPRVVDGAGRLTDLELHLDGRISLGDDQGSCGSCHGAGGDPAPPPGLEGERAESALAVGAHRSHLQAPHRLRGPLRCEECHLVPAALESPGHLDSELPAEVFSAATGLAAAGGALPRWDHAQGRCADVYCHGGGPRQAGDAAAGLERAPRWIDVDVGAAACGSCHGIPPLDTDHAGPLALSDCATCHADTVDRFGNLLLVGPGGRADSAHIDGVIDVQLP